MTLMESGLGVKALDKTSNNLPHGILDNVFLENFKIQNQLMKILKQKSSNYVALNLTVPKLRKITVSDRSGSWLNQ